ncbi:TPA: hypothetical protein HA244_02760 [Candidatus Micrarchaeota archaeon]|nr:hypothetical protein [Candidatus Micrarchaeota archaeon]
MDFEKRLVLDTTVLIGWATRKSIASFKLVEQKSENNYSNEYCLKELRWFLGSEGGFSPDKIGIAIDAARQRLHILPTPQVREFKKLVLPDKLKSDLPVIKTAVDLNAVLVSSDWLLRKEARKYVETATPEEIAQR